MFDKTCEAKLFNLTCVTITVFLVNNLLMRPTLCGDPCHIKIKNINTLFVWFFVSLERYTVVSFRRLIFIRFPVFVHVTRSLLSECAHRSASPDICIPHVTGIRLCI